MITKDYIHRGNRITLAKRIGKGGEGEVFRLPSDAKKAVKIYTGPRDPEREAKVRAMAQCGIARTSTLVAFPEDLVTTPKGEFAGFTMRLVEGYRQLHDLYGPKSRKAHYPTADYRFLVRAAANAARAIGQVHASQCVIGDVNHSGILVSRDAIVALIDADSFQLKVDNKIYHCVVGVPEFTPPELQGASLKGILRTEAHDNFGLAVAIFLLLFMGRHPYHGMQKGGDIPVEKLIAQNQFAYSRTRKVSVSPPGIVATLEDFPPDVANAFERAFGPHPHQRPGPAEWANILQTLEATLTRCSAQSVHFYPSAARNCPWCRMENASGVLLFLPPLIGAAIYPLPLGNFDVEKAWMAITVVIVPDPQSLVPPLPSQSLKPSAEAMAAKDAGSGNKILGILLIVAAIALFIAFRPLGLLSLFLLVGGVATFNKTSFNPVPWNTKADEWETRWEEAIKRWHAGLGYPRLVSLRAELERSVKEYRGLNAAKLQAVKRLASERQTRQLNDFLGRFLIRRAAISGIGPAKTATLASFGIESAADVSQNAVMAVPGFGTVTTDKLLQWRATHERKFVYNPSPQPSDTQAKIRVDVEFAARADALAKQIRDGHTELAQLSNTLRSKLTTRDSHLSNLAAQKAQLDADFTHLGLRPRAMKQVSGNPLQPSYGAQAQASQTAQSVSTATPNQMSAQKCPSCGSSMVRRTARRGARAGRQFWGCSRYPSCTGTRP